VKYRRSPWVLTFSLVLAAVLLFLALRNVDWVVFWDTIVSGHYAFLLLMIPIASINYFIRAIRWSIFVRSEKKVSILSVFWANMVGYMGNSFLPARAGELLRSVFLGRKSGLGTSFVLATALVERTLDAVALVLIGSLSLLWLGNISPLLASAVRIMAIASIVVSVVIIIAPYQEALLLRLFGRLPLPLGLTQKISEQLSRFLVGIRCFQNWRRLSLFILLTFIIWIVDAIGNMVGVRIISQTLNLSQALILLSALGLSSAIPSTPGYVGVYQFVAVTVLVPFGFTRPEALAYILISQVLGYVLFGFWGLLGLWQLNRVKVIQQS
jgi:glycosyltransferase 2 family protein